MELEKICGEVCALVKRVGLFLSEEIKIIKTSDVEMKGANDFVTYVDKTSEQKLIRGLSKIIPDSGFIAEENTVPKANKDYIWIIDPLDGTTNFIHSVPLYSISIALMYKNELVLGVIYEINSKECFCAWKDGGAYLNGNKISVSKADKLKNSLLATGFPYYDFSKIDRYLELFKYFMQNTHGVRRLGSAAVDLAWVACGRFDGFYEYSLKSWDVAAGIVIVKEAGGKICDFSGKDNYLFGQEIIATNDKIYDETVKIIFGFFEKNN